MAKNFMILNGAARKNGSTRELIQSFSKGACSAGHHIQEFYLDNMNIHSCKGCLRVGRDSKSPCTQKDDMEQIYSAFADCDVVVFASPRLLLDNYRDTKNNSGPFVCGKECEIVY